jgi:hypothetical protein
MNNAPLLSTHLDDFPIHDPVSDEPPTKCIVRLKTSTWSDSKGIHFHKKISYLRRKSSGYQLFEEDVGMIGADQVVEKIENLDECEDGIYEVRTCNERRDWETGYIDDYDYWLVPYHE